MGLRKEIVSVTTETDGTQTAYTTGYYSSRGVVAIQYAKTDFADGVDFTITAETSGVSLWTESNVNASEIVFPSMFLDDGVGADTTTRVLVPLLAERVKIVIAQGGSTTTGAFTVWME